MAEEHRVALGAFSEEQETQHNQAIIPGNHLTNVPTSEIIDQLSRDDLNLLDTLEKQNDTRTSNDQNDGLQRRKIGRVPEMLREKFKVHYNPRAIAIGPIHHDNFKSELLTTDFKSKLAAKFIKTSRQSGRVLLSKIKTHIKELKNGFDQKVIGTHISDEILARMLFLDGCAVLQFIYSFVCDKLIEFEINNSQAAIIQQDLFLLENQIPFKVLELLMYSSEERNSFEECINTFIYKNIMAPQDDYGSINKKTLLLTDTKDLSSPSNTPVHLLDLLRRALLDDVCEQRSRTTIAIISAIIKVPIYILLGFFVIVWMLVLCCCCCCCICCSKGDDHRDSDKENLHPSPPVDNNPEPTSTDPIDDLVEKMVNKCAQFLESWYNFPVYRLSFRSVQELKAKGIKLKPSKLASMKAISFKTRCFGMKGTLELPPLNVDTSTVYKLWNLVAYEMCPDNYENNYAVTSYLSFLDSLIDTEQDVKDLRSVHILSNRLSSDVEVANLFNTIGSHLLYDDKTYREVKTKIQMHYQRRYAFWIAQVGRDHFSSPWKIIALFGAITALLLTAIQTWYAVYPKKGS